MLRVLRSVIAILAVTCASAGVLFACSASDGDRPPPAGEDHPDAANQPDRNVVVVPVDPCDPPAERCPCADAGAGTQIYCGTVYRTTNKHVDCAKGYRTCIDPTDGGTLRWGACEGPRIFNAD